MPTGIHRSDAGFRTSGSGAADSGGESGDLGGEGGDHVVEAGPEGGGGDQAGAGEDGEKDRVLQHRGARLPRSPLRSAHDAGFLSACPPHRRRGRFMSWRGFR